ncbi:MAG: STAS domain-containing protein [Synechococcales bacterium]|nr:STAS domain-containing protein [Synechococcales bacterium]
MTTRGVSVVKVRDVLLVTVPSDPSDLTLQDLQEQVLDAMEQHEAKGLIIDISAIETLDSFFARTIAETGQMVRLMGGLTVIAGMRPRVAMTTTQLGLTFSGIITALNVDRALDRIDALTEGGYA